MNGNRTLALSVNLEWPQAADNQIEKTIVFSQQRDKKII